MAIWKKKKKMKFLIALFFIEGLYYHGDQQIYELYVGKLLHSTHEQIELCSGKIKKKIKWENVFHEKKSLCQQKLIISSKLQYIMKLVCNDSMEIVWFPWEGL